MDQLLVKKNSSVSHVSGNTSAIPIQSYEQVKAHSMGKVIKTLKTYLTSP